MKKIAILIVLVANVSFAQGFFHMFESEQTEEVDNSQGGFFEPQSGTIPSPPEQGANSTPNPADPIPLDGGWYFLLAGGIALGFYFLHKVPKGKTA